MQINLKLWMKQIEHKLTYLNSKIKKSHIHRHKDLNKLPHGVLTIITDCMD